MSPSEELGETGELGQEDAAGEEDDQVSPFAKIVFMKDYRGPKAACSCPLRKLPQDLPVTLLFDLVTETDCETQKLPLISSSTLHCHCGGHPPVPMAPEHQRGESII